MSQTNYGLNSSRPGLPGLCVDLAGAVQRSALATIVGITETQVTAWFRRRQNAAHPPFEASPGLRRLRNGRAAMPQAVARRAATRRAARTTTIFCRREPSAAEAIH